MAQPARGTDAPDVRAPPAELAAGRLQTPVTAPLPLPDGQQALELASGGGLRGEAVLVP